MSYQKIESRLVNLENKIGKKLATKKLKDVPSNWHEFAQLTTIRSGNEMKKFVPYEYQKIMIDLANKYNNIIVLKSRQMGITQAIASHFLHQSILNPANSACCFMRTSNDSGALSRRVREMLGSIKEYASADNDNVTYLKMRGGGDIYFKNSSPEGSRSLDSVSQFLFDECAFVPNIQQIYAASSPSGALAGDSIQKFIISTPSAKSGWYWDKINENNGGIDIEQIAWEVAEGIIYKEIPGVYWFIDQKNTCKLILHWKAHPIYSQFEDYLGYRLEQDGTDEETIQREYNLRFIDSSVSVFDSLLVRKAATGIYEEPNPDATYYAGLDTSTCGADYTVLTIWEWIKCNDGVHRCTLVYLYRKRKTTNAEHIYRITEALKRYKPSRIGIEVNAGGQIYFEQLSKSLPDLSFQRIKTTADSKPGMISNLVLALEKEMLEFPEKCELVNEMLTFRREGNKYEAASGKHDDVVMSSAFALAVTPFGRKNPFGDVII